MLQLLPILLQQGLAFQVLTKYLFITPGQGRTTLNLGGTTLMRILVREKQNEFSQSFARLLQIIKADTEIKIRIIQLLMLNPFRRRLMLNKWLERLRCRQAPEKLIGALSCLFDDDIAENVLTFIYEHPAKDSEDERLLKEI